MSHWHNTTSVPGPVDPEGCCADQPSVPTAAVVRVLSDHINHGRDVRWVTEECDWVHWWKCLCGFEIPTNLGGATWFEDHVAQMLAVAGLLADEQGDWTPPTAASIAADYRAQQETEAAERLAKGLRGERS